jgi:hypothetical protein
MFFEMVQYGMVVLTGREKTNVADADVVVGWMLYAYAGYCWSIDGREEERKLMWCGQEWDRGSPPLEPVGMAMGRV